MRRLIVGWGRTVVLGSCLLLWAPAAAIAAAPVPEDFSAADQYVESVPTSEGSKPAGPVGTGTGNPPPTLGSNGGDNLEQIATSPELGAPRKQLHRARADEPDVPSALVSAIGEQDGGGNLLWLVLALLLVSGVVAGTAGHRHYRNRQTAGSG
jgi:hypothetical protein